VIHTTTIVFIFYYYNVYNILLHISSCAISNFFFLIQIFLCRRHTTYLNWNSSIFRPTIWRNGPYHNNIGLYKYHVNLYFVWCHWIYSRHVRSLTMISHYHGVPQHLHFADKSIKIYNNNFSVAKFRYVCQREFSVFTAHCSVYC
jgi:hypothetical protein